MKKIILTLAGVVVWCACASAQVRPGAFTTVVTTSTAAKSLCVGADVIASPTACTGGVQGGAMTAGTSLVVGVDPTGAQILRVGGTAAITGATSFGAGIGIDGGAPATHGIKMPAATPGVVTSALYSPDGAALYFNGSQLATGSAVSGTAGQLAKFTAASTLGDSLISEAGVTLTALAKLKLQSGQTSGLLLGADAGAQTLTINVSKNGIIAVPHYNNVSNPMYLIGGVSGASTSVLNLGGGITNTNAATQIVMYTGANNITDTGTARASLGAGMRIGSTLTDPGAGNLYVEGTTTSAGAISTTLNTGNALLVNTNKFLVDGATGGITSAGILTMNGFGAHGFMGTGTGGQTVTILNSSGGTTNHAALNVEAFGAPGGIASTTTGGLFAYSPEFTTSGPYIPASVAVYSDGEGGMEILAAHASGAIRFYSGGATERMRIDASGNVGVGVSPASNERFTSHGIGTSSSNYGLVVTDSNASGNMWVRDDGVGYLKAAAWVYGSDRRLKEHEAIIGRDDAVTRLVGLVPKYFDYINGPQRQIGFIAQDVQPVIPEAVTVTDAKTGTLGLKTEFVTPLLVVGWQQHDKRIADLEAEVERLKAKREN